MIVDTYASAPTYRNLSPNIEAAFAWLDANRHADLADGRHDIREDAVFALVQTPTTRNEAGLEYEAHRSFIDLQYVVLGTERMLIRPVDTLTTSVPYNAEKDVAFYAPDATSVVTEIVLHPESFAIFFPQDAHLPLLHTGSAATVHKIVVKIAL